MTFHLLRWCLMGSDMSDQIVGIQNKQLKIIIFHICVQYERNNHMYLDILVFWEIYATFSYLNWQYYWINILAWFLYAIYRKEIYIRQFTYLNRWNSILFMHKKYESWKACNTWVSFHVCEFFTKILEGYARNNK
jgi:hypothetical protein